MNNILFLLTVQLNQNQGDKGPDSQAEMFRQMLAQHMVSMIIIFNIIAYGNGDIRHARFLLNSNFLDVHARKRRTDGYDRRYRSGRFVPLLLY